MHLRPYSGRVFRNFATIIESQELTDDLTEDPKRRNALKAFFYDSAGKAGKSAVERVLEKSESQIVQEEIDGRFRPERWCRSRYSDGTWGLLYAAESEETALREVLFHLSIFYQEEFQERPVHLQRRVLALWAETKCCVDLTLEEGLDRGALVSKDESGYPYGHALARQAMAAGALMLRAPSARHDGGHCTPIFDKAAIARDEGHLKYLRCVLKPDGTADVTPLIEEETKTYALE